METRRGAPREQVGIVSFAYVHEGQEWFAAWAEATEPRTIDVRDERSSRSYRIEVRGIHDASHEGVVYEAEVVVAERL